MKSSNTMQDNPAADPDMPVRQRFHGAALFAVILPVGLAAALAFLTTLSAPASQADPAANAVKKALPGLLLPFIANSGQLDPRVAFYAHTYAGTAFLTNSGDLVMSLPPHGQAHIARAHGWTLIERPVSSAHLGPVGVGQTRTHVSVFRGNDPHRERTSGLATFRTVQLGHPWPGVSLDYRAYGNHVERIFTLEPGARAGEIRMQLKGAERLYLQDGELLARTGVGTVRLSRPVAMQEIDGSYQNVSASYTLKDDVYGFRLGPHDATKPVIIDPILRTTYLGTPAYDDGMAIALGPDGSVYVTGLVWGVHFPGTAGGAQPTIGGSQDAFISRLSPDLSQILQSTYLGGSGSDMADAITVAPDTGNVYVVGRTNSTDFPGTAGGAQPTRGGDYDAFVTILNSSLTQLIQSTYLGGSGHDEGWSIVISPDSGNVYVGGWTNSADFPGTAGGAQPTYGGAQDGFVVELTPNLHRLLQATYVGGSGEDWGFGLTYASGVGLYFVGGTSSQDFPGAPTQEPEENAFVVRLNGKLTRFINTLVFGGSGLDEARRVLWIPNSGKGAIYVSGITGSTDFPATAGGAQPTYGGGQTDVFVAEMGINLHGIAQATYFGGNAQDDVRMVLGFNSSTQTLYIAGMTRSTNLPATAGGAQPFCRDLKAQGQVCGKGDGFVASLNLPLTEILQATYFGADQHDGVHGLAIAPSTGNVYISFGTMSTDLLNTQGAPQPNFAGGARDAGVSLLTPDLQTGAGN
ncbi:MAG: SBBP repeat-containing protein [Gammaproteobacteria bacterium]